ncbi:MAG: outer membrane beta-barrel protein [Sphingobacteriales bacterium]|nr:outer membrane beta-barrel protein [Sphingobacteriales bacterium]
MSKTSLYIKSFSLFIILNVYFNSLYAQQTATDNSKIGFSAGALSYTGRFSVGTSIMSHTSWNVSAFYVPSLNLGNKFDIKAELMAGQIKGDNTSVQNPSAQGSFTTNIVELAVKGEYSFVDIEMHKISPYINAGPGFYTLLNYKNTYGVKSSGNKMGFVLPAGLGVKVNAGDQLLVFVDGSIRLFNKNIDNIISENNPNKYMTVNVGISYNLKKRNILW